MTPVRLVLDTSTIALYGVSVHVGEPIAEVRDEGALVGLPALCLAEAFVEHAAAVRMLAEDPVGECLGVNPSDWPALGAMRQLLGRLDVAAAFLAAEAHDCVILTARPDWYAPLGDNPPIIEV